MLGEPLYFHIDERACPVVRSHLGMRCKVNTLLLRLSRARSRIRHDQRNHEPSLIAHNHRIRDVRTALESVLNGLRSHKLSARGLDQVLLAIGDKEVAL